MNQKEKVLNALTHMLARQVDLEQAERVLECARRIRIDAEAEFVRVLRAVYGDRSLDGVLYKGRRYYVEGDRLCCENTAVEVLG